MAADYSADQRVMVTQLQNICSNILDNIARAKLLQQEAVDKGYAPGTPTTGITDALLFVSTPQLLAADLTAALTAITSLDTQLAATSRTGYKSLERMRP